MKPHCQVTGMRDPWASSFGLHLVESQMNGGEGLSVKDVDGKIDGEDRGKQDDSPKATTSPDGSSIGKKAVSHHIAHTGRNSKSK